MKILKFHTILLVTLLFAGCGESGGGETPPPPAKDFVVQTTTVIHNNFIGNGAQWGGYDFIESFTGSKTLSQSDWNKLSTRVGFMRPGVVRIMCSEGWNYGSNGDYTVSNNVVLPVLDFCQNNGITVIFGEWGHQGGATLDEAWLDRSISYLDWLVTTKGYSCIKYFVMVNEPNGNWASTDGNYSLWQNIALACHTKMSAKGLLSKVELMGPDIAYWNHQSATSYKSWISYTVSQLANQVTAYDIHAYPGQKYVRSGEFTASLTDYKRAVPEGRDIFMSELGCKYPDEPELNAENNKRKKEKPYTGDDSNMFIYDAFYAIDIADALIQCMNAGYAGNILWAMDDAMYCQYSAGGAPESLKRWGFWNILGEEGLGGVEDEQIRPWFYTASLMSRYFPTGSKVYSITSPDKRLKAVAGEKNGKFTVAIVNSTYSKFDGLKVRFDKDMKADNMKVYQFSARTGKECIATIDANGLATPLKSEIGVDMKSGYVLPQISGLTFTMITNMD